MESPEEYYDSLDEDSNYGSLDNDSVDEEPEACPINSVDVECSAVQSDRDLAGEEKIVAEVDTTDTNDDIIPYYEKDLTKSDIELSRIHSKSNSGSDNKSRKEPGRKKSNTPLFDNQRFTSRSYLNMFQAKIENKCLQKKLSLESSSVTCLNSTPKSFVTCQDFDVNSVYHKIEDFSETESFIDGRLKDVNDKQDCSSTVTSLDSKFYSISEQYLNNICDAEETKSKRKTKSFNKVPVLGGLGPEIPKDKLYLFKKRQQYGQQVNQKNRIKIIERKLLQNLNREMKECSNINI